MNWSRDLFQITILHGVFPFVDYVLPEQSTEYATYFIFPYTRFEHNSRPELNQVILSLITTENQAGIPLYMKAHSRNANDAETFEKLVKSHISSLKAAQHCRYLIGDSALYTAESILSLQDQNQYFITTSTTKNYRSEKNFE